MKIGAAEFRKLVQEFQIKKEQLDVSEGGGIFRIKAEVGDRHFSCEVTARDERQAKLCLGL